MSITPVSDEILKAVKAESIRAAMKHPYASLLLNPDMPYVGKLAALMEEVGEVAQLLTYDKQPGGRLDRNALYKELIQVANLAAAWAQSEDELIHVWSTAD